jgi:cell division protein FtsB
MSRNRIKNSQSLHWMGVVKWVIIAGLLAVLGLSYMLCKNQNLHLAEETHRLQLELDGIDRRNEQMANDLASMKSPQRLVRELARNRSSLVRLSEGNFEIISIDNQQIRGRLADWGTLPGDLPANITGYNSRVAQTTPAPPASP